MTHTKTLLLPLVLAAVLSACNGSNFVTPTAPSLPSARVPPTPPTSGPPTSGQGSGTIAIRELSPAPGATLAVQRECPAGSVTRMCAEQWRGTFDVMVDREMTNAVLNVRFYDGQTLCGYGTTGLDSLPAGMTVPLTANRIALSDAFGTLTQPCRLPVTTSRIEVVLWLESQLVVEIQ